MRLSSVPDRVQFGRIGKHYQCKQQHLGQVIDRIIKELDLEQFIHWLGHAPLISWMADFSRAFLVQPVDRK